MDNFRISRKLLSIAIIVGTSISSSAFENVDFTRAAEATVNTVVSIKSYVTTIQQHSASNQRPFNPFEGDPFFEFFFGPSIPRQQVPQQKGNDIEKESSQLRQNGLGSGVILNSDGLIVTNNHVIDGADKLEVTLNDNRTFEATVVGTDANTDLAVIKIDAENLNAITIGDSEHLQVGEWVLAVGNPFGFTSTVTAGIVSAKARNISTTTGYRSRQGIESYIQTDAAVNPGNSGGALVNLKGELIGINTAIYSQTGNYAGNSFAIPTSIVSKIVDDIVKYGAVQRALLGISFTELTPQVAKEHNISAVNAGIFVAEVVDGSSAADAGIQPNDVIVSINGNATTTTGQLQEEIAKHRPGDNVIVTIVRDNKHIILNVTFKNAKGDDSITLKNDVTMLGCKFKGIDQETLTKLRIPSGLQVVELSEGKFKDCGIREGFIIVDINNVYVKTDEDVKRLYDSIISSTEYDHVMFISGIYPGDNRKTFYAVDIAE